MLSLLTGEENPVISNIEFDSRKVTPGTLFVAVKGYKTDGHDFINSAIASGASAVICENLPENPDQKICWIKTSDSAKALGIAASNFFGNPSSSSEACRGYRNKWKNYYCNPALQDVYSVLVINADFSQLSAIILMIRNFRQHIPLLILFS